MREPHEAADDRQVGEMPEPRLGCVQPGGVGRDAVVVLNQADNLRVGKADGAIGDPDLMDVVRVDQEVVRPIQMRHPFLVRSIERTVLANDQFVIAPVPETGDEVVDVRYPIERMQDERERGTVAMRRHLGLPARLVAPDPLHEVRFNGRHGFS